MKKIISIVSVFILLCMSVIALDDIQLQNTYQACKNQCKEELPLFRCDALCDVENILLFYEEQSEETPFSYNEQTYPATTFTSLSAPAHLSAEVISKEIKKTGSSVLQTNQEGTFLYVPALRYNHMVSVNDGEITLDIIENSQWLGKVRVLTTGNAEQVVQGVVKAEVGTLFLQTARKEVQVHNDVADVFVDMRLASLPDGASVDMVVEKGTAEDAAQVQEFAGDDAVVFAKIQPLTTSLTPQQTFVSLTVDQSILSQEEAESMRAVVLKEGTMEEMDVTVGQDRGGFLMRVNGEAGFYPTLLFSGTIKELPSQEPVEQPTTPNQQGNEQTPVFQWILVALFIIIVVIAVMQQSKKK